MPPPSETPRIDAIFEKARNIADAAQRAAYLDQACDGERKLRDEIESLLAADQGAAGFMKLQTQTIAESFPGANPGDRIGR